MPTTVNHNTGTVKVGGNKEKASQRIVRKHDECVAPSTKHRRLCDMSKCRRAEEAQLKTHIKLLCVDIRIQTRRIVDIVW